jgi:hypothetical protein
MLRRPGLRTATLAAMAHGKVSEAVCVGIAASNMRSFLVAVWSNLLNQIVRLELLFDLRQNKRAAQL